jgi:hypothetical protein
MKKNGKPRQMGGSKSILMVRLRRNQDSRVCVVIRDHLGTLLLYAWHAIYGPSSTEEVEARAFSWQ